MTQAEATAGQNLIAHITVFAQAMSAERERVDVTQTQNAMVHLYVELTTVLLDNLGLGCIIFFQKTHA